MQASPPGNDATLANEGENYAHSWLQNSWNRARPVDGFISP